MLYKVLQFSDCKFEALPTSCFFFCCDNLQGSQICRCLEYIFCYILDNFGRCDHVVVCSLLSCYINMLTMLSFMLHQHVDHVVFHATSTCWRCLSCYINMFEVVFHAYINMFDVVFHATSTCLTLSFMLQSTCWPCCLWCYINMLTMLSFMLHQHVDHVVHEWLFSVLIALCADKTSYFNKTPTFLGGLVDFFFFLLWKRFVYIWKP